MTPPPKSIATSLCPGKPPATCSAPSKSAKLATPPNNPWALASTSSPSTTASSKTAPSPSPTSNKKSPPGPNRNNFSDQTFTADCSWVPHPAIFRVRNFRSPPPIDPLADKLSALLSELCVSALSFPAGCRTLRFQRVRVFPYATTTRSTRHSVVRAQHRCAPCPQDRPASPQSAFFFVTPRKPKSAVAFLHKSRTPYPPANLPPPLPEILRRRSRSHRAPPSKSFFCRHKQSRVRPPAPPIPPPPRQKLDERPQRPHLLARSVPHVLSIQSHRRRLGRHALESRRQRRHDSLEARTHRARSHSRRRRF